jgi:RNA polymerase sigma-70 factor (ECF subfamily)
MQRDPRQRPPTWPTQLPACAGGEPSLAAPTGQVVDPSSTRSRISAAADMRREPSDQCSRLEPSPIELTSHQRELFDALYREHFDFVFRNLRRLGVTDAATDDALQDVYLVALRRIAEFQVGTHPKAWLFAILFRVAGNHRRSQRRRGAPIELVEERIEGDAAVPFDVVAQGEARRILHAFLEKLDDNRRAVFVMAELEQMTAPEIGEALSANVNTVYSWLRSSRIEFARMIDERRDRGKHG